MSDINTARCDCGRADEQPNIAGRQLARSDVVDGTSFARSSLAAWTPFQCLAATLNDSFGGQFFGVKIGPQRRRLGTRGPPSVHAFTPFPQSYPASTRTDGTAWEDVEVPSPGR